MENDDLLEEIENFCEKNNLSLIDGIVSFCEDKQIEVETIGALIKKHPLLRDKMYLEASKLNLVQTQANLISFII